MQRSIRRKRLPLSLEEYNFIEYTNSDDYYLPAFGKQFILCFARRLWILPVEQAFRLLLYWSFEGTLNEEADSFNGYN